MKNVCMSIIIAILLAFWVSAHADYNAEDTLEAVLKIRATVPDNAYTAGSLGTVREGNGIVIDSKGHILTIGYLILEAETIEVYSPKGHPVKATFVGYDHKTGFGLLRAKEPLKVAPMKLGRSSTVGEGDPVLIVSHGGSDSVQGAHVVARREFTGYWEYLLEDALYVSPPHPNYGGAALIGRDGQLLGIGSIFTQIMVPEFGVIPCNMFVPIDRLKPILTDLISIGRAHDPPQPWLGLHVDESHGRVIVIRVSAEGPAARAGLNSGDIILTVNQSAVKGVADFYRKVWALGRAGVEVPLSILQGTRIRDVKVRSGDRYELLRLTPRR
ncbi:MAG: serine protease [Deltaproteobacteria bacterium]|nr:MAG: serine protease [Deltaproteobacteria bacterium]